MKPPAFQFYVDDYLGGTRTMKPAQKGSYVDLLCIQWSQGYVSDEDLNDILSEIEEPLRGKVLSKFKKGIDGLHRNQRLEIERKKLEEYRENRSRSGQKGAATRWHSHSTAITQPMANGMANDSSPSPTPLPVHRESIVEADVPTLTEIKAEASMRGIKPEVAQAFFDHYEGNALWLNQHGRLINWRVKLAAWQVRETTIKTTTAEPSSPATAFSLSAVIRAKETLADALKRKHASDVAGDTIWTPASKKAEWIAIRNEIKELNARLAGLRI